MLVPDYEVDGLLFLDNHYPGGHIFRDRLNIEAIPSDDPADWRVNYAFESDRPTSANKQAQAALLPDRLELRIPVVQKARPRDRCGPRADSAALELEHDRLTSTAQLSHRHPEVPGHSATQTHVNALKAGLEG